MSELTLGIVVFVTGCYGWKLLGLSVPEHILEHPLTIKAGALIPVALLAALVAVQTLAVDSRIAFDARLIGLGVSAILLSLRVPFLPMLIIAAGSTAIFRLFV